MKKHIGARISEELYNELQEIAKTENTTIYKVLENVITIGVKYIRKKGFGVESAIRILINAYNTENPNNKI